MDFHFMKACLLRSQAAISTNPLAYTDVPEPRAATGEILIRVSCCGVCQTDLHVIEGDLPERKSPLIPGHQVVGVVAGLGDGARRFHLGARVGIPWLHRTDQTCEFCRAGKENLCDRPSFTGYTVDGGYAQFAVAPEDFVYPIPESFPDEQAASLLCAGIIGFRCLRLAGAGDGARLGIYGFGAAGHIVAQVALWQGRSVYAFTRKGDAAAQDFARRLGASYAQVAAPRQL